MRVLLQQRLPSNVGHSAQGAISISALKCSSWSTYGTPIVIRILFLGWEKSSDRAAMAYVLGYMYVYWYWGSCLLSAPSNAWNVDINMCRPFWSSQQFWSDEPLKSWNWKHFALWIRQRCAKCQLVYSISMTDDLFIYVFNVDASCFAGPCGA